MKRPGVPLLVMLGVLLLGCSSGSQRLDRPSATSAPRRASYLTLNFGRVTAVSHLTRVGDSESFGLILSSRAERPLQIMSVTFGEFPKGLELLGVNGAQTTAGLPVPVSADGFPPDIRSDPTMARLQHLPAIGGQMLQPHPDPVNGNLLVLVGLRLKHPGRFWASDVTVTYTMGAEKFAQTFATSLGLCSVAPCERGVAPPGQSAESTTRRRP